jgi:hypothetical protein
MCGFNYTNYYYYYYYYYYSSLKKQNKPYIYFNEEEGMEGEKNISITQKTQKTWFLPPKMKSP